MEKEIVVIDARRDCYDKADVTRTMTVRELIEALEEYDDDALVMLSHDNGYTYGGISRRDIEEDYINTEEDK